MDHAPSLADIALFLAYYSRCTQEPSVLDVVVDLLDRAIRAASDRIPFGNLHSGVLKVAWVRAHLERHYGVGAAADVYRAVDEAIVESLSERPVWLGHFDLVGGLGAFAVYLIERLPSDAAAIGLAQIVEQLDLIKSDMAPGVAWYTWPQHQPPSDQLLTPDGHFALGVAHGTAGMISVLRRIAALSIAPERASRLSGAATEWLLRQQRCQPGSRFARSSLGGPRQDAFYGWCWGDLGIAAALLSATCANGAPAGQPGGDRNADGIGGEAAVEIAWHAARNPPDYPIDACLCHGAAGNGHLFNRIAQASRQYDLQQVATEWFMRTVSFHEPGHGIGGFVFRRPDENGRTVSEGSPTMLLGSAGIGLACLAAASDVPPEWDRLLGLFF